MCDVHERIEAGGLDEWSDAQLNAEIRHLSRSRGRTDSDEAIVLAELARRGRNPATMFGNTTSAHDAERRTKTAIGGVEFFV